MRLISQDGTYDIPYESAFISINKMHTYDKIKSVNAYEYRIIASPNLNSSNHIVLGIYKNEKSAKYAMAKMREAYKMYKYSHSKDCSIFAFPVDDAKIRSCDVYDPRPNVAYGYPTHATYHHDESY